MNRPLVIYGSGGHGKVVADAALCAGWHVLGFADDDPGKRDALVLGLPVVAIGFDSTIAYCRAQNSHAVIALGDNRVRQRVFDAACRAQVEMATIIHPSAVISPSAAIGHGSVVFAHAVVNPASTIGCNVIINTGATIDHDNVIGDHAHVAPGAHTGGTVQLGAGAMLGVGASVRNHVSIGEWSIIGIGAAVVADIPARVVAFGNPARVQRRIE